MKRLDVTDPATRSADLVAENIATLRTLFPELITEGANGAAINVDVLKALVGDATVTDADEKYGLNWFGKRRARQLALTPSTGTLRPCPEDSVDWDTTKNLMIEGDNLEVLKLLQKSYADKVKLIYIDPPYNTGEDFVYPDNYRNSIKNYLELTGKMEGGHEVSSNREASGRFHTDWLNMLYPRIKLAKSFLKRDGFFVASIDDAELPNLRSVLDDIFGSENFVADLVFDRNRKNDAKLFSVGHEYMVIYAKDRLFLTQQKVKLRMQKKGVEEVRQEFERLLRLHGNDWDQIQQGLKEFYSKFDEDDPRLPLARFTKVDKRGPFRTDGNPSWPGGGGPRYDVPHPITGRPCKVPSRGWVWPTYERMREEIDAGNIVFGPDEATIPAVRMNLFDKTDQVMRSVIFSYAQKAAQEFSGLFDGVRVFDNPKSYRDMAHLIEYLTTPGDIVLDFFAGSGSTAHGALLVNSRGILPRRWLLVQLPELLDPHDKDQRIAAEFCRKFNKPPNIAEITKERLRRAAKKITEESPMFRSDVGFRVFKLDSTNIRAWDPDRDDLAQSLEESVEHLKADRTEQDILYELLLKLGQDLCVPIETRTMDGAAVHSVGGGVLIACLVPHIAAANVEALGQGIVAWRKELATAGETTCVFRDSAFADDVAKTNLAAILEQSGIATVRSL